jgi:glutamate dehydrogenase
MLQENIDKQIKIIEQIALKSSDKNLKQFINLLYAGVPYDELRDFDQEYLFKAATSTFRLLQLKNEEFKIHVYKHNKTEDQVILEVISPDIPFLVDSLTNQLKIEDFDIHLISHPTISVKRDMNGHYISMSGEVGAKKEAILQFHVSKWCDDEYFLEFIKRIEQILNCINLAVRDWQAMTAEMVKAKQLVIEYKFTNDKSLIEETEKFLNWLIEGNFIFLGAYEAKVIGTSIIPNKKEILGVVNNQLYHLEDTPIDAQYDHDNVLFIRKWDTRSVVHRTAHMDHIIIKKFDANGVCINSLNFLGFFTSSVYYQSVRNIPLIGKKINNIIARYGYPESSHNCKELVTALEAFPRGELIQMTEDELYETATGIVSLVLMPRVKLFLRKDKAEKFISCLIFIPKARFSTDVRVTIEKILCRTFNGFISKQYVNISESQLARLQILVRTQPHNIPDFDIEKLEEEIRNIISIWSDDLYNRLQENLSKKDAKLKYTQYKDAFDIKYTSTFSAKQAVFDIGMIETAIQDNSVKFNLYQMNEGNKPLIQLKIYSPDEELALSSTLPILEHLGFYGLDVLTFRVALKDLGTDREFYIHHFRLQARCQDFVLTDISRINIEKALDKIWDQGIEDDRYNSLILYCNLTWRQANILRAYSKYLKQINFSFLPAFIVDALTNNAEITQLLIDLFESKFDPYKGCTEADIRELAFRIDEKLSLVKSITEDKVLKAFLNIILATKRTNYFLTYEEINEFKEYISFKISSSEVTDIPLPKPYAEIFVYSPRVEAIHLRGGKVARGGLRWSDRSEDFRTEVLGLMKAQMTKNAVIVPVGSKGGFVLKKASTDMNREELFQEGIECYKTFLSGLLDITDNVIEGKVTTPKNVVSYDDDDPYLVVAADKGTATFSDYANSISLKYNFWLGDAFASGGSVGYDHKKMGITAKGAWVSVERHFRELGIDIITQPFTVVGIGDMSGDVFGNGMLLSKQIKLIAAFNHVHIFLDPNPDPEKSFEERLRLFNLPRSQWSDYNPILISKGGGIFNRNNKVIKLTPEVKQLIQINEDEITPDFLIKAILKAPVDLLWNGGIGTYVKSTTQSHEKIGDKTNDALRVNGRELRCKVVGEGGNLGFTQLGRIEYAKNGGKINTDFIDNSAGVDCSDHEVNIKITFSDALRTNTLSLEERNKVLEQMQDEVSYLVLQDNYKQSLIISIEEEGGSKRLDSHSWLMRHLENKGELDREIEFLPLPEQIATIKSEGGMLTRPEISVLVAYAKNSIYKMLSGYDFSKDEFFNKELFNYFPSILKEQFKDHILNHKLRNEIIATSTTNDFVNMLGCCFFHQMLEDTTHKPYDIIKAFVVVREIFDIQTYWRQIESLIGIVPSKIKNSLFKEMGSLLERNINWFLRHHSSLENLNEIIRRYKPSVERLFKVYKSIIPENSLNEIEIFIKQYEEYSIPIDLLESIITLKSTLTACDIVSIALERNVDVLKVGKIFYLVGEKMHLSWMLTQAKKYNSNQYVENIALRSLISEIEDIHMNLTRKEVSIQMESSKVLSDSINACCLIKPANNEQYNNFISELKASSTDSWVSLLIIAIRRVKEFLNG